MMKFQLYHGKVSICTIYQILDPVMEATAVFDFEARSPRELSFKRGETLVLYNKMSADWWEGCFKGKEGLIPDKYIALRNV